MILLGGGRRGYSLNTTYFYLDNFPVKFSTGNIIDIDIIVWPTLATIIHHDPLWPVIWARYMSNYDPLWPTMTHYDQLWLTMTRYDPHDELCSIMTHYAQLWPTMIHMIHYDPLWPASGNSLQLGKTWIWYILKMFLCLFDLSSFTKESLIITAQIICCTSSVPRRTNSDIGIEKSRNLQAWTRVQQ